jgi:hypothetical protein
MFQRMVSKKGLESTRKALIPLLQLVVQASAAFGPLQSAAGGLLKVLELVDVRSIFVFSSNPAFI